MPAMPRIPGKPKRIAYDILGVPANMPEKQRKRKKIREQDIPVTDIEPQENWVGG